MTLAKPFTKIVHIGRVPDGYPKAPRSMFAKIEFTKDGRLSISGVVSPKANGDAHGSSGQFIMSFREYGEHGHMGLADIEPAPGWDADTVRRFFDAWDTWHLNDMRANCPHQTGPEWDT